MESRHWLEIVSAGILATAFGAPLGDVLKWILWKFIAVVWERLILGWGYVGAQLNTAPEIQMQPNANVNADDFTDFESGETQIVLMEVRQVLRRPCDNLLPEA